MLAAREEATAGTAWSQNVPRPSDPPPQATARKTPFALTLVAALGVVFAMGFVFVKRSSPRVAVPDATPSHVTAPVNESSQPIGIATLVPEPAPLIATPIV